MLPKKQPPVLSKEKSPGTLDKPAKKDYNVREVPERRLLLYGG